MINTPCSAWVALSVPRAIDAVARKICCQHPPPRIPLQAVACSATTRQIVVMRRKRAVEKGTCGMQVALDTLVEFALSSNTLSPLGFTRVCHDAWYSCSRRDRAAAHINPPQAGARYTIWVCWEPRGRRRLHASKQRVRTRAGKEKDSDESPKIPAAAWQAAPGAVCRDWAGWHEAHAEKESVVS